MNTSAPNQIAHVVDGAVGQVARILADLRVKSLFMVADEIAFGSSGAEAAIEPAIAPHSVERFTQFQCDAKLPDVQRGIDCFGKARWDAVLAVGGGSTLDVAKLISNLGVQDDSPEQIVCGAARLVRDGPPLIAIPTTAGTGSEATHFAVCYVAGKKYSLTHRFLLPEFALVDPQLTHSLPPRLTAASGLDAFCQAVESLWAIGSSDASARLAREGLCLASDHLVAAVHQPTPAVRAGMSRAAHLAGRAINLSKTTAPHAISYAISMAAGVPHGLAVALTLPAVLLYNSQTTADDCVDPRGPDHVRSRIALVLEVLACDTPTEAAHKIENLIRSVGGHTRLCEVGLDGDADIEMLIERVNTQRLSNNPRSIAPETLRQLLHSVRR